MKKLVQLGFAAVVLQCLPLALTSIALAQNSNSIFQAQVSRPVLDWDSENVANYRAMNQALPSNVSTVGLAALNASGSAQFNAPQFLWIKNQTKMDVFVVDLREESHAIFNQTKQIGWQVAFNSANRGLTLPQILKDEQQKIAGVLADKKVQMYSWENLGGDNWQMLPKVLWDLTSAQSESEVVGAKNYLRVPVTDHEVPKDEQMEVFLNLVATRGANTWLHFHCLAGMGRTTTFLAMLDILANAPQVSFEDILERQTALGGLDLLEGGDDASRARRAHLTDVYAFAQARIHQPKLGWTAWKQSH